MKGRVHGPVKLAFEDGHHRWPVLYVDEMLEFEPDERLKKLSQLIETIHGIKHR